MLEYVVQNSIEGNLTALKERMVGSAVFGRPADYDVANDPVVRIAAGEVRKRLSQYFSEHPGAEVRIELPAGGYVAEFLLGAHSVLPGSDDLVPAVPTATPTAVSVVEGEQRSAVASFLLTGKVWITLAVVLAIALAATWANLSYQMRRDFWRPVLAGPQSAVIVVGKKDISSTSNADSSHLATAGRTYLSFNDTMLVAQLCSIFRAYNVDCNLISAPATSLEYMHGRPIIFIGAFNNEWTLRMMQSLRYQIQRPASPAYVAGAANTDLDIRSIVEHKSGGDVALCTLYGVSRAVELGKDCALVARFHSTITDSLVVIVAGLGPEGTDGARQYITKPENLKQLIDRAPKGWGGENFEAVLQIDIVHGSPSRTDVLATNFW